MICDEIVIFVSRNNFVSNNHQPLGYVSVKSLLKDKYKHKQTPKDNRGLRKVALES